MKISDAIKQEVEDLLIELLNDRLPWMTPITSVGVMFLYANDIMLILCRIYADIGCSQVRRFEGQQYKSKIHKRCQFSFRFEFDRSALPKKILSKCAN